jgi:hypothetical protein
MSIPFASPSQGWGVRVQPALNASGVLTSINVLGFTGNSPNITVTGGTNFTIPFNTDQYQYMFSLPYNATLIGVSAVFNTVAALSITSATTDIRPFVAIATPAPGTYNFTIIQSSILYPSIGFVQGNNPTSTVLTAANTLFNVPVAAGTPVAIVGGLVSLGTTAQALQPSLYVSGSLVFGR